MLENEKHPLAKPVAGKKQWLMPVYHLLRKQGKPWLFSCISLGGLFILWYLATAYKFEFYIRFSNIPTPYAVWQQAAEVAKSETFYVHIAKSLQRILTGFAIAALAGITLGVLIGRSVWVYRLGMPAIEVLRPIPAIAWVPISIMLWPTSESSIIFITFVGAFYPILINTIHGVHMLDEVFIRAGRSLGTSEWQLLWHVVLPGSMPSVFTGLEVGMGVAWVSLIAAEMISGQYGVGYFTWESYSLVNYPSIVLGMITIGLLGLICSGAIRAIAHFVLPWRINIHGRKP